MTNEKRDEAIRFFETMLKLESNIKGAHFEYSKLALEALEQEPCGDCISREETLKALMDEWTEYDSELIGWLYDKIDKLPSVSPQPKLGYMSIDDVMSVFDDFMCGEVDEDGMDTFLEMLKDKAEGSDKE